MPEGLFELRRVGKVPPDAVNPSEYDTKYGEDDHAGPAIAFCAVRVERRDMGCARMDRACCDDAEDGVENKGDEED